MCLANSGSHKHAILAKGHLVTSYIFCPQDWQTSGKKGIWITVPAEKSQLIPVAVQHGFTFHHAEKGYVMLTRWLPTTEDTLPPNASHQVCQPRTVVAVLCWCKCCAYSSEGQDMPHWIVCKGNLLELVSFMTGAQMHMVLQVGVGAFVVNSKREVLVVQERFGPLKGSVRNSSSCQTHFQIIHATKYVFIRLNIRRHLSQFHVGTYDYACIHQPPQDPTQVSH